jgi:hypothetical protein
MVVPRTSHLGYCQYHTGLLQPTHTQEAGYEYFQGWVPYDRHNPPVTHPVCLLPSLTCSWRPAMVDQRVTGPSSVSEAGKPRHTTQVRLWKEVFKSTFGTRE